MGVNKNAMRSLPSLKLLMSLRLYNYYFVLNFLPLAIFFTCFDFNISNRYNYFPIRYLKRYSLKAFGMAANPKIIKATIPPIIPKV
jgi:hypothetical protein